MTYKAIDLEQLLMLHGLILAQDGGSDGVRDLGRLEAALATQFQEVFGTELYPSVHNKAAALMRGVVADHPFVDGNKRTATLAGLTILKVNGVNLTATNQELENFAVSIAVEHFSVEEITAWLEKHSTKSS